MAEPYHALTTTPLCNSLRKTIYLHTETFYFCSAPLLIVSPLPMYHLVKLSAQTPDAEIVGLLLYLIEPLEEPQASMARTTL